MKIPRWAQVLIGVGIVMVFLGIGAIIAITAYFSENVAVTETTASQAGDEFEKVRQRFKGQVPLVVMKEGERAVSTVAEKATSSPRAPLHTLHVLAWDAREEKLANVNIPWWVLRLKSGPIRFSTYASGLDDDSVRLRPEDIERHGPGMILDLTSHRGDRVLLWAE